MDMDIKDKQTETRESFFDIGLVSYRYRTEILSTPSGSDSFFSENPVGEVWIVEHVSLDREGEVDTRDVPGVTGVL
jgi:hypothetical protein